MPPTRTSWTLPEQFDEYRLIRMLGRGNMGVVFLGHDLVLDRPVAIKFLNNVDSDPRARERFLTEARAAARIHHPNVMAVHRVGELEGRLYIIGEYIRGKSLSEISRPVSWQDALKIAVGLARGLACAHRQGVLHRDIKLANAMQSETGEVKLLDFSLAKLLEGNTPVDNVTVTPSVPGELESTIDPAIQIDPGARGGRLVDSGLHASPRPVGKISEDLGATMTRRDPQAIQRMRRSESSDGVVVGTPFYMAPELWRAVPASRTTDVYALGVLLYILCSNCPPIDGRTTFELARLSQETRPKPLRALAPGVDPRFAEIVDRCLRPATEDRYTSGDELCSALENLASEGTREATAVVQGNPYRGLQAFEARHRAVFFGRGAEIRAVNDRLRGEPFLLVAGDSGVGKSSLCRAGVLPVFAEQAVDGRAWSTLSLMPGRRPLQTLVSALAAPLKVSEDHLRDLFETDPGELTRVIVRQQGKSSGLVLFIDQLEELVTLADPVQRIVVGRFLAEVASGLPGVRLLATARGDFLTRVAALPELGRYINAAIYLLTPLTPEGVREAIVGPARLQGVNFESEALIETLGTAGVEGNLPLLQFALAELWEARDPATRRITTADLERIGRVTGALTRHADNVVAGLPPSQRVAVRRLLMRLVTIEDTRASMPLEDLVLGDVNNETALEALVRGRLVVAREAQDGTVYEIAHEALIRNWDTLQRWITEERESREIYHRLEVAALEWQRLGGTRVGLWTAEQLLEADKLERTNLRPRELEFLAASRTHLRRQRRLKWLIAGSIPTLVLVSFIVLRVQQAQALAARVDDQLTKARSTLAQARAGQQQTVTLRKQAYQQFDAAELETAEQTWTAARVAAADTDRHLRRAIQEFDLALNLDNTATGGRQGLAESLLERALAVESSGKEDLAAELIERLETLGDEQTLAKWNAPGRLSVRTTPPAPVVLERYELDPASLQYTLVEPRQLGRTPVTDLELPRGSYRLRIEGPAPIVMPALIRRDESLALDLALPRPEDIPEGFVYVPEGRFQFGSDDDEMLRKFFVTVPQHDVTTPAYLIARHETTYAEWIEFLESLPSAERKSRLAVAEGLFVGVFVTRADDGTWSIAISTGDGVLRARRGESIVYPGRTKNATQDWLRMPATNLNVDDIKAYVAWLARTGKVPGARVCDEREWERAARGADGRNFPNSDRIGPEDAHIDGTYGRTPGTLGPDAVGLHPASRSPFGLDDASGNVGEWVRSALALDEFLVRSGAYVYEESIARIVNRVNFSPETREPSTGLRVCADPRASRP
jgi:serine/threonine protein kinase/formylglycine-generating enzyme required for sulfatase activity